LHAPVLIVPRVFEPAFCQQLMAYYEARGGAPSGTTHENDEGKTYVALNDAFKRRFDCDIEDAALREGAMHRIYWRLGPEIERAFAFKPTRMERYIVACYDSGSGGYFKPHRDNTTKGTAHRRFAVTINLNAEAYEGGDLRFPEYGPHAYRAPSGGAVVFSCALLHEAAPVTKGKRYAFLPFLYDEEAAKVRAKNNAFLDESVGKYEG
jgi:predicted 2-oxoglutarate/Fe(II)-dependent dioxygenase YbiX